MDAANTLLHIFPQNMRGFWQQTVEAYEKLEEIRIRAGKPIIIKLHSGEFFLDKNGNLTQTKRQAFCMEGPQLLMVLNQICRDSIYAYEDEIRQGFLTVPGGHRVGIAGQVVTESDGRIRTMKHIAGMNIRVAHQIKGAADEVLPYLYDEKRNLLNALIISPPGCGKTTLLRDMVRQISDGNAFGAGLTVGVVDERSEIAGSYLGKPQNDVGIRTDVLDACPKVHGMMMLIRAMAPQVVAIDELGSMEDVEAMRRVSACGCRLLATVHGEGVRELWSRAYMEVLIKEGLFERYIVLDRGANGPRIKGIYRKESAVCSG